MFALVSPTSRGSASVPVVVTDARSFGIRARRSGSGTPRVSCSREDRLTSRGYRGSELARDRVAENSLTSEARITRANLNLQVELVPQTAHGGEVLRLGRARLDLGAQPLHVHVEG